MNHQTQQVASPTSVAMYLAERSRPQSLSGLIEGMGLSEFHRSTVWRWLKTAQDQGMVEMAGDKKSSVWRASDHLLRDVLRKQIGQPVNKRPLVPYQEDFLLEYEPNRSSYLSKSDLDRLHRQCQPGTAEFTKLTQRDQSLFMCGLSFASSAMEGNSYDLIATEKLLLEGLVKEDATPLETTMVLNHHDAARHLVDNIHFPPFPNDVKIETRDIKELHGLLASGLLADPGMCGSIRHAPVKIHQSSYVPPVLHDVLVRNLQMICAKASQIEDPFEKAFFLLVHLPYLQPFEDCNKRTSRVACNIPLLRHGVVPMSWLDVDHGSYSNGLIGVYERNNPSILAEVFVDGYLHSTERFEIMKRTAVPTATQVRYRSTIKQVVRAAVLDGDSSIPGDVEPKDVGEFILHVEKELALLRKGNLGAMVRFGLAEGDVRHWNCRTEAVEPDEPPERIRERASG